MPIPENAFYLTQPMDPEDLIDYTLNIKQGDPVADGTLPQPILATGETIASFTLALTTEAMAAGLILPSDNGYGPQLFGLTLKFWLSCDPDLWTSAIFDEDGVELGLELSIVTTNDPPRHRQVTIVVQVQNQ